MPTISFKTKKGVVKFKSAKRSTGKKRAIAMPSRKTWRKKKDGSPEAETEME